MVSSYLKYYRESKAREERPIYTTEKHSEQYDEEHVDTHENAQASTSSTKTRVVIVCGVLTVLLVGVFMYRSYTVKGGTPDKATKKKKELGDWMKEYKDRPDESPAFYSPDTNSYECSAEGTNVSVYDCRKDINCMWLYNGHDVNSGICTHRVLRPAPSEGCKAFKKAHECNMRNDRYIWKHGKCMTRPL